MITTILLIISFSLIVLLVAGVSYFCYRKQMCQRLFKLPHTHKSRVHNPASFPGRRNSEEEDAYELRMQLEMRRRQKIAEGGNADDVSIDSCEWYGGQEDEDIPGKFIRIDGTPYMHSQSIISGTLTDRSSRAGSPETLTNQHSQSSTKKPYRLLPSPPLCDFSPAHGQSDPRNSHGRRSTSTMSRSPVQGIISSFDSSESSDDEDQTLIKISYDSSPARNESSVKHKDPNTFWPNQNQASPPSSPRNNGLPPAYTYKTLPPTPNQTKSSPYTNDYSVNNTDISEIEEYFDGAKYKKNNQDSIRPKNVSVHFAPGTFTGKSQGDGVWPPKGDNVTDNNNMSYNAMRGVPPVIPMFEHSYGSPSNTSSPSLYERSILYSDSGKENQQPVLTDATIEDNNYFDDILASPVGLDDRGLSPKGAMTRRGDFGGKKMLPTTTMPHRPGGFFLSQFEHI